MPRRPGRHRRRPAATRRRSPARSRAARPDAVACTAPPWPTPIACETEPDLAAPVQRGGARTALARALPRARPAADRALDGPRARRAARACSTERPGRPAPARVRPHQARRRRTRSWPRARAPLVLRVALVHRARLRSRARRPARPSPPGPSPPAGRCGSSATSSARRSIRNRSRTRWRACWTAGHAVGFISAARSGSAVTSWAGASRTCWDFAETSSARAGRRTGRAAARGCLARSSRARRALGWTPRPLDDAIRGRPPPPPYNRASRWISETLEDHLRRATRNFTARLPEERVFALGRDLARELARAHAETPPAIRSSSPMRS